MEIKNKKAYFDYFIDETLECGISLWGNEVKSIKEGMCSIKESYCTISDGNLVLKQMHITPYKSANRFDVDENRDRVLLAHKREIRYLIGKVKEKGMTIIPLKVYVTQGKVKVLIGLCRGKKLYDKRESIKKRDMERAIRNV